MSAWPIPESSERPVVPGLTVLGVLGQGGSAVVYLARQDQLERRVALKVIRHPVDDPRVLRAFDREVKAVARLSGHRNVITIYTTGRTPSGQPYLVTEYADRGSLADILARQGPLPTEEAAVVGLGVARALAAAHGLGIIHRDVKPANVLLTSSGEVKLADFGIARLLSGTSATTTGTVAFTPEHVAPEVLKGSPAGEPADVYGLASTLVEALTGQPPFGAVASGTPIEAVLTRKLTTDAVTLPATVPARLRSVLAAALTPDVDGRPLLSTLRAVLAEVARDRPALPAAEALAPVPRSPTVRYQDPGVPDELRRSRRRRRILAPVIAAVAALAVGIGSLLALTRHTNHGTSTTATPLPVPSSSPAPTTAPTTAAPTTAAPVTAAPTTAAPATAAPATAAPRATSAPTAPPATAAPRTTAAPVDRSQLAETFLRTYYAAVGAHDYQRSWPMLSPQFQASTAGGYASYVAFWDRVTVVEVRRVDVQPPSNNATWPIVANLAMRYTVGGRTVDEIDQLTVDRDASGTPLIVGYRVAGPG